MVKLRLRGTRPYCSCQTVAQSARLHSSWSFFCLPLFGISSTMKPQTVILPEASRTKTCTLPHRPHSLLLPTPPHPLSSSRALRSLASPSTPCWHSKPDWRPWHASHLFKSENVYPRDCGLID